MWYENNNLHNIISWYVSSIDRYEISILFVWINTIRSNNISICYKKNQDLNKNIILSKSARSMKNIQNNQFLYKPQGLIFNFVYKTQLL